MAFIIEKFDKYNAWDRMQSVYKFELNGQMYAIKEVELEWGKPQFPIDIERDREREQYFIYNTVEEAMEFVHRIKSLN